MEDKSTGTEKNPLFSLYEKLYFHEIEIRENLTGRLQTPLAILVSLVGVLVFLLQHVDGDKSGLAAAGLRILLLLGGASILAAGVFFVLSWFGSTYGFLPSAEDTEQYRLLLSKTYSGFPDGDKLSSRYLDEFLCQKFIECATRNTKCNDFRSLYLHRTNGALIIATATLAMSFMVFFGAGLDSSQSPKPTRVIVVRPIDVRGQLVTDQKPPQPQQNVPPPPPPPPPTRLIREGVEIQKPKPPGGNANGK